MHRKRNIALHTALRVGVSGALLWVASALAAETKNKTDRPEDYGYALPLTLSGKQGVVGVRLPQAVYRHAHSTALHDLRVFDANGVRMPFALQSASVATHTQRQRQPVAVFPITGAPAQAASQLDLEIKTSRDGAVVGVKTRTASAGGTTDKNHLLTELILDTGLPAATQAASTIGAETVTPQIAALHFSQPAISTTENASAEKNLPNYRAKVWLETSNDLQHWEVLTTGELSWLTNANGQHIGNDRLEFPPRAFRYARLRWQQGAAHMFGAVTAEWVQHTTATPLRETLWLKPVVGKQAGDWLYAIGQAVPVEAISLRLQENNLVLPVEVGQYVERPNPKNPSAQEWIFQPVVRSTFYQITQNNQTRRSDALPIAVTHIQNWVVRPLNVGADTGSAGGSVSLSANQPELGVTWQPATLVFLNAGKAPYALHFGRAESQPAAVAVTQVAPGFSASDMANIELAQTGVLQTRTTAVADTASAAGLAGLSARQRSSILWGVLLLGVAVLGVLAWRLLKQMK